MPLFADILCRYKCVTVLDPFAGTGKIHSLPFKTVGVEIEKEWAEMHPQTIHGDALNLPFNSNTFDAICTSPTYGNRMADHHDAKDSSKRITYRHVLGRELNDNNSGKMQWGDKYKKFHQEAWVESKRVLKPNGIIILNVSNHIRNKTEQPVTQFHIDLITNLGLDMVEHHQVNTPRMRYGRNNGARIDYESVIVFRRKDND